MKTIQQRLNGGTCFVQFVKAGSFPATIGDILHACQRRHWRQRTLDIRTSGYSLFERNPYTTAQIYYGTTTQLRKKYYNLDFAVLYYRFFYFLGGNLLQFKLRPVVICLPVSLVQITVMSMTNCTLFHNKLIILW